MRTRHLFPVGLLAVVLAAPAGPAADAPDPPTPAVRLHVGVASVAAAGKPVGYKITVTNTSPVPVYRVRVRVPLPGGVEVLAADPKPGPPKAPAPAAGPPPREVAWEVGTLDPRQAKIITLDLRPADDAREVRVKAFVAFEYGEEVSTKVERAKLAVSKNVPREVVAGEPIPVRVTVRNDGRVPVTGVRLAEDWPEGFEFGADGDRGEAGDAPRQRVWKLDTLRPGEQRVVQYRLTGRAGGAAVASSAVTSPDVPDPARADARFAVLAAAMKLELTGPPAAAPGDPAEYTATVTNSGTLPLADVRLTANVPDGSTVTRVTNGGRASAAAVAWVVPDRARGPLQPGDSYAVRFTLAARTGGPKVVRVAAAGDRVGEVPREVSTNFQAAPDLSWEHKFNSTSLVAGTPELLTVTVTNAGGEAARNVRLRVDLPDGVTAAQVSPAPAGPLPGGQRRVAFDPVSVPANGAQKFTLTVRAEKPGPARFEMTLGYDGLGDPLTKRLDQEVTRGR